jgi:hypothetical protein
LALEERCKRPLGSFIDMFDVYLPIGVLAPALPYFAPGGLSGATQATIFYVVFAVTMIGRPLGAVVFGEVSDRLGRRRTTLVSVAGFGVVTRLISALLGYDAWRAGAIVALVALRLVNGVFIGGAYSAANPLAMEYSPKDKRGLNDPHRLSGSTGVHFFARSADAEGCDWPAEPEVRTAADDRGDRGAELGARLRALLALTQIVRRNERHVELAQWINDEGIADPKHGLLLARLKQAVPMELKVQEIVRSLGSSDLHTSARVAGGHFAVDLHDCETASGSQSNLAARNALHRLHAKLKRGPRDRLAPEFVPVARRHVRCRDHGHRVRPQSKRQSPAVEPRDGDRSILIL